MHFKHYKGLSAFLSATECISLVIWLQKPEENTEHIYQKESEVRIQLTAVGMQVKVKANELMFYLNFLSTKEVPNLQY